MVFLSYWTFAKAHGSQLPFLESLMRARDDLDKGDVNAIMESARRKVKQENMPDIPESGPTIMSRVAQAHAGFGSGILANLVGAGSGGGTGQSSSSASNVDGGDAPAAKGQGWSAFASAQAYLGAAGWRKDGGASANNVE